MSGTGTTNTEPVVRDESGKVISPKVPSPGSEDVKKRAERKIAAGLIKLPEPPKDLLGKSIEELNALSDDLDDRIGAMRQKKREIHAARIRLAVTEQAAIYGLTPEEYAECKKKSKETGVPLQSTLGKAKRARAVQVARTSVARTNVKSVKG